MPTCAASSLDGVRTIITGLRCTDAGCCSQSCIDVPSSAMDTAGDSA